MSKFHDDRTVASDAVGIALSAERLRRIEPKLYGWRSMFCRVLIHGRPFNARQTRQLLAEHVQGGDSRAAMVVRRDPLLVAAFTDEQDCVVLLQFPRRLAEEHHLDEGSKLLTVNTYVRGGVPAPDLILGPKSLGRWTNFYPVIAPFVSDDRMQIENRMRAIATAEWDRTVTFAKALLAQPTLSVRDGHPTCSFRPGKFVPRDFAG